MAEETEQCARGYGLKEPYDKPWGPCYCDVCVRYNVRYGRAAAFARYRRR